MASTRTADIAMRIAGSSAYTVLLLLLNDEASTASGENEVSFMVYVVFYFSLVVCTMAIVHVAK